jgi:hypothetical protein
MSENESNLILGVERKSYAAWNVRHKATGKVCVAKTYYFGDRWWVTLDHADCTQRFLEDNFENFESPEVCPETWWEDVETGDLVEVKSNGTEIVVKAWSGAFKRYLTDFHRQFKPFVKPSESWVMPKRALVRTERGFDLYGVQGWNTKTGFRGNHIASFIDDEGLALAGVIATKPEWVLVPLAAGSVR